MAGGLFLNVAERARMQSFPDEICRDDLIVFFTLCAEDILEVGRLRPAHNRLGFALSLGALRYLGFIPVDLSTAPPEAVEFVAHQVDADPDLGSCKNSGEMLRISRFASSFQCVAVMSARRHMPRPFQPFVQGRSGVMRVRRRAR